jgi:glycosyltransferase involved in cell wall biosynthesis
MTNGTEGVRTLYLCYFGVEQPLVQTQVLPYLRELRKGGVEPYLLTFEPAWGKWTPAAKEEWRRKLAADGIEWSALPYHKRPTAPATLFDIAAGAWTAARLVRRHRIHVLHARAHVPAAMGALAKRLTGARWLFDLRGLVPDEYVDAGLWQEGGRLHRLAKTAERRLLKDADGIVVLTQRVREELFPARNGVEPARPLEVIPCCADLTRFIDARETEREQVRGELGLADRKVLVYLGALGGYYLTDELAEFLAAAHRQDPRTFAMVLTQSDSRAIEAALDRLGMGGSDRLVRKVPAGEVPRYLAAADAALAFYKPSYSKIATSPTKLAEYLASGLPVVFNSGIGDVDAVVAEDRVGVILREFSPEAYVRALRDLEALTGDPDVRRRCQESARRRFDLESTGGEAYRRLYSRLLAVEPRAPAMSVAK